METPITWGEAIELHATDEAPEKKKPKDEDLEIGSAAHKKRVHELITDTSKTLRELLKTARKYRHTDSVLTQRFHDELVKLATVDLPRVGIPIVGRENMRMQMGVVEKMRYELSTKFFFDTLKRGSEVPHTARGAAAIMAVSKADALLEALGYDVDAELPA